MEFGNKIYWTFFLFGNTWKGRLLLDIDLFFSSFTFLLTRVFRAAVRGNTANFTPFHHAMIFC